MNPMDMHERLVQNEDFRVDHSYFSHSTSPLVCIMADILPGHRTTWCSVSIQMADPNFLQVAYPSRQGKQGI